MDSSAAAASANSVLQSTYGAWLIGVFFAIFLQGVLTLQAWNYYNDFPDDIVRNKLIVSFVWILDTIHLGIVCQIAYHFLVTDWGFEQSLDVAIWELRLHILFVGVSCFTCQIFFLQKIWIFSKRNYWVTGTSFILCLFTLAMGIFTSIDLFTRFKLLAPSQWSSAIKVDPPALFASGAVSDFFLAGLLCYYLRPDLSAFKGTRSFIKQIIQYIVVTGILTCSLELCALIMYLVTRQSLNYAALHICLGRLYTNSVLAVLNTRKKVQSSAKGSEDPTVPHFATDSDVYQKPSQATGTKTSGNTVLYTIERVTQHSNSTDDGIEMGQIIDKTHSLV